MMYDSTPSGSSQQKRSKTSLKIFLGIAAVLALAIVLIMYMIFAPKRNLSALIAEDTKFARVSQAVGFALQHDETCGEKMEALLEEIITAQESLNAHSLFYAALLAQELTDSGFSAEKAQALAVRALTEGSYKAFEASFGDVYGDVLHLLLAVCPQDNVLDAYNQCVKTAKNQTTNALMPVFAEFFTGLTIEEKYACAAQAREIDVEGLYFFGITPDTLTLESVLSVIDSAPEDLYRDLVMYFAGTLTEADDILGYIKRFKADGINPSELYPDGVQITSPVTGFVTDMSENDPQSEYRFIILNRTANNPPLNKMTVRDDDTPDDGFGYEVGPYTSPDGDEYTITYIDNYTSNALNLPETFTCTLDTVRMDIIPLEYLPDSLADCNAAIMLDTMYVYDSVAQYTTMTYTSYNGRTTSGVPTSITHSYYPCYATVQKVSMVNPRDNTLYFDYDMLVNDSPDIPQEVFDNGSLSDLLNYYRAKPDADWFEEPASGMIELIDSFGWDLDLLLLLASLE